MARRCRPLQDAWQRPLVARRTQTPKIKDEQLLLRSQGSERGSSASVDHARRHRHGTEDAAKQAMRPQLLHVIQEDHVRLHTLSQITVEQARIARRDNRARVLSVSDAAQHSFGLRGGRKHEMACCQGMPGASRLLIASPELTSATTRHLGRASTALSN
eukprot:CAMPEP_0183365528 /NCGR_PEP_ID=MMETSP0164_2-20130417/85128_1 /TAXON_ID=221442 /ORGANISM="Coccolithus pelagicus ssp braarudi, Strain PLY182g" /LENGTH=158 /DNA_ID=CAMNT_0025541081 /DNA_START=68 /DNA_END=545 /DNA_ORIENTATION=+